jgi:hypothetical protein
MRMPALDDQRRTQAIHLAAQIYTLHEAGRPYDDQMRALSLLTGQSVTRPDVGGAFGSMSPEDWAQDLLLLSAPPPSDLEDHELVEMVAHICAADTPEWLQHWFLRCVEHATGCDEVTDIIYYPRDVFGDDAHDELTPAEIVAEAKKRRRRVLVTPAPKST